MSLTKLGECETDCKWQLLSVDAIIIKILNSLSQVGNINVVDKELQTDMDDEDLLGTWKCHQL
jgi:hypothetical protein